MTMEMSYDLAIGGYRQSGVDPLPYRFDCERLSNHTMACMLAFPAVLELVEYRVTDLVPPPSGFFKDAL